MRMLARACGRAVLAQLRPAVLLRVSAPLVLALLLWGLLLWQWLGPLVDSLQAGFVAYDGFSMSTTMLGWFGLAAYKAVVVPLLAMWLLLPLMVMTALLFVGMLAMPSAVRACVRSHFATLEIRRGGSWFGSLFTALGAALVFGVLWLLTLPLSGLVPVALALQAGLLAWLTARVMSYDALALHASASERVLLRRRHRWPLLLIGLCGSLLGAVPTLIWLGGPLAFILFPLLAAVAIFLYVLVIHFTGLWFSYYCLDALQQYRQECAARPLTSTE